MEKSDHKIAFRVCLHCGSVWLKACSGCIGWLPKLPFVLAAPLKCSPKSPDMPPTFGTRPETAQKLVDVNLGRAWRSSLVSGEARGNSRAACPSISVSIPRKIEEICKQLCEESFPQFPRLQKHPPSQLATTPATWKVPISNPRKDQSHCTALNTRATEAPGWNPSILARWACPCWTFGQGLPARYSHRQSL